MITVLCVRGTGEAYGSRTAMLAYLTPKLDTTKYCVVEVDYPASIGPANPTANLAGVSEQDSITAGVAALATAIRATPDVAGLLGYSLGAMVISRFLEAQARGDYADCEIAWAATVANPLRAQGSSIDPGPVGFGLAGQHGPWPDGIPVWEAANPADPITSCPADSPLRSFADGIAAFSVANMGGWTQDLIDRFRTNRWQPGNLGCLLHPIDTWKTWSTAASLMEGYVLGGEHTTAYLDGGYLDRLAAAINATEIGITTRATVHPIQRPYGGAGGGGGAGAA